MITGLHTCQTNDSFDLVWIDKKMLTERLIGVQPKSSKQLGCSLGPVAYRLCAQSRWRPQMGQGRAPSKSKSFNAILS